MSLSPDGARSKVKAFDRILNELEDIAKNPERVTGSDPELLIDYVRGAVETIGLFDGVDAEQHKTLTHDLNKTMGRVRAKVGDLGPAVNALLERTPGLVVPGSEASSDAATEIVAA